MFLMIFTAYQCKVHRVVARKVHPSLLGIGKNYAWATKLPHAYCAETPVRRRQTKPITLPLAHARGVINPAIVIL